MKNYPHFHLRREAGAVLVVGLVMVLLISIIALSAIRSSNLQEAMAGNMRDRNIAFQAAESALVVAEAQVHVDGPGLDCTGQATCYVRSVQPYQAPKDSVIFLDDEEFDQISRKSGLALNGVEKEPTYIIEEMSIIQPDDGAKEKGAGILDLLPYRITAKGTGLGADSTVVLQSTYNRLAAFNE